MSRWLWQLRARLGYWLARRLFHLPAALRQPRLWQWMQGQYGRMANLGDSTAQSFYGHILLFRGQGLGAREEGLRLLRLAANGGDGKAAIGPMLREYVISEAMHALGVPTTRSLAVVATGRPVRREAIGARSTRRTGHETHWLGA